MRNLLNIATLTVAAAVAAAVPVTEASAQIRASEPASVSQTVDGTVFTIDYSRPRLRGRKDFLPKPVLWDEVWTPGANLATTLRASKDFTINGHPLPAGKYSVWIQVREKGDWTFVVHGDTMRQHYMHPKVETAKLSFPIAPETVSAPTDVLTWSFPEVTADGATLTLDFATHHIPVTLGVTPTLKRTIIAQDAEPYLGSYEIEWLWDKKKPVKAALTLRYDARDQHLMADTRMEGEATTMILARLSEGVFSPIFMLEGQIGDSEDSMLMEFTKDGSGRPMSFQIRDRKTDELQARGVRK